MVLRLASVSGFLDFAPKKLGRMSVTNIFLEYQGIIMGDVSESMQQMTKQPYCRKPLIIIINWMV